MKLANRILSFTLIICFTFNTSTVLDVPHLKRDHVIFSKGQSVARLQSFEFDSDPIHGPPNNAKSTPGWHSRLPCLFKPQTNSEDFGTGSPCRRQVNPSSDTARPQKAGAEVQFRGAVIPLHKLKEISRIAGSHASIPTFCASQAARTLRTKLSCTADFIKTLSLQPICIRMPARGTPSRPPETGI